MDSKEDLCPFQQCCTLSVSHNSHEGTSCGILLDTRHGLVIAHGSLISHILSRNSGVLKDLKHDGFSRSSELSTFKVDALFQEKREVSMSLTSRLQPSVLTGDLQEDTGFVQMKASIKCVFVCWSLKQIIRKLLPSENWEFAENVSDVDVGREVENSSVKKDRVAYSKLMPCFLLLRIHNWKPYDSVLTVKSSCDNNLGDRVEIQATPFGGVSPEVFFNSKSQGIISNLAGRNQVLILTDARCIPGSEGGPLYYCDGSDRILTGIIVTTLCWKNNEWIGLSLAGALSEILDDLSRLPLNVSDSMYIPYKTTEQQWLSPFPHKVALMSVPFVSVAGSWGSGILWGLSDHAVVLTCSHVVKAAEQGRVKLTYKPDCKSHDATVVYRTPQGQQFDIAVLVHKFHSKRHCSNWATAAVQEGESIFVIGYGMFGESVNLEPTITSGIVSKIVTVNNRPVMLQTTCAVHAGASGGAVINTAGKLVGMVVCNARDTTSHSSFPHVNMCVPVTAISHVIERFIRTNDEKVLHLLHNRQPKVQRLWTLERMKGGAPSMLSSKL